MLLTVLRSRYAPNLLLQDLPIKRKKGEKIVVARLAIDFASSLTIYSISRKLKTLFFFFMITYQKS